jgi:hypothetical protein
MLPAEVTWPLSFKHQTPGGTMLIHLLMYVLQHAAHLGHHLGTCDPPRKCKI